MPLSINYNTTDVYIEGQPVARGGNAPTAMNASVGLDYFETLGVAIVRGRDFVEGDREDAPRVIVVNETFARRFFPGADPSDEAVGKRVSFGSATNRPWQIVGVARDGKSSASGSAAHVRLLSAVAGLRINRDALGARVANPDAMIAAFRDAVRRLEQLPRLK